MKKSQNFPVDKKLEPLKTRFALWRQRKAHAREPIPEKLWDEATQLVMEFGRESVSRVANTLGISYEKLASRLEAATVVAASNDEMVVVAVPSCDDAAPEGAALAKRAVLARKRRRKVVPIKVTRFDFCSTREERENTVLSPEAHSQTFPVSSVHHHQENRGRAYALRESAQASLSIAVRFRELELTFSIGTSSEEIQQIFNMLHGSLYGNGGHCHAANFCR